MTTIKPGSFADGIRKINTNGAFVIPVRLTKKRARLLIDFIEEFKRDWNNKHEEGHHSENDMQSAMQWILNQVSKRWSQNELYSDTKKPNP